MATKTKTIYGPKPTEVSVTQKQTTGTNIATITVNGTATELYAPNGGSGGGSDLPVALEISTTNNLDLTKDEYDSLYGAAVGTRSFINKSLTFNANYQIQALGVNNRADVPVIVDTGTGEGRNVAHGFLTLTAANVNDTYTVYAYIRIDTLVRYNPGDSTADIKYLFGSVSVQFNNPPITYDVSTGIFTIPTSDMVASRFTFILYNSIESGGSGGGAGVSDVDWTGQYNADNGVELGTLTITTTD